jgi:hypothetical protein
MMMDKLVIKCNGNVNKVLDRPDELLADYLWNKDIEVTYIHNIINDGVNTILFYGYEGVDGLINEALDKRKSNNLYKFLKSNHIEPLSIEFEQCDDDEYIQYINDEE